MIWQVRRVMTWSDAFGCGEVRFGKAGRICSVKVVYVKFCWVPVRQVRCVTAS